MPELRLRVERIDALTQNIRRLLLSAEDGHALPPFEAGAHLELQIPGPTPLLRAYSLVNRYDERHYELAIQREDQGSGGSRWLHGLEAGAALQAKAPRNHFPLQPEAGHSLLIAGGIGITAILAMARTLGAEGQSFELHYAGREAAAMAYLDEVRGLPQGHCWISGETASGRLPLRQVIGAPAADKHLYVCGPKRLMEDTLACARELGWDDAQLHYELFAGSLQSDGEQPFEAELRGSGVTLQVPAGGNLLDAMLEAGLDPLFDCRRGDCGVCVAQVLEGEAEHRDICLSERERAAGSFCTCVSRARGARLVLDL